MQRGIATMTLDTGVCPPWLFERMVKLGRAMTEVIVEEYGPDEFVKRIADPVWFQSLGTVLAFDWNASGLTTILTAALKEAIRGQELELGIFICGGKGKTSRRTPEEIYRWSEFSNLPLQMSNQLVASSKMSAKVDSSLIQDNYQIYHHSFFFTPNGSWTVVQQGMNTESQSARRYHWHEGVENPNFVNEPHTGIASQITADQVLNLTATQSTKTRDISVELLQGNFSSLMKDIEILRRHSSSLSKTITLKTGDEQLTLLQLEHTEFQSHPVIHEDFSRSTYLEKVLEKVIERQPGTYEAFLGIEGVGPKTVRALSLVSEIIYGANPSYTDPARYSFAHGGKDETPYPVDTKTYDKTIQVMQRLVEKAKLNPLDKDNALRNLTTPRK